MGTSAKILLLSIAISLPAIGKSVQYQPISITVNENFNAQPGSETQEMVSLVPNVIHQGANFYFNPRVQLPLGVLPPHISALLSSRREKNESIFIESKPGIGIEEEIVEIHKPIESNPVFNIQEDSEDIIEMPGAIELVNDFSVPGSDVVFEEEEQSEVFLPIVPITKPEEVVIEENSALPLIPISLPTHNEQETFIQELVAIPEAPVLPPLSIDVSSLAVTDILSEIPKPEYPQELLTHESIEVPAILPVAKPIEVIEEKNIDIPSIPVNLPTYNEHQAVIQELAAIPEAPELPPSSINFMSSVIVEEVNKKLKPEISEVPIVIEELVTYPEAPVLPPLPIELPIPTPGNIIEELVAIPDAPILPPLSIELPAPVFTEEVAEIPASDSILISDEVSIPPIEVDFEENFNILSEPITSPILYDDHKVIIQEYAAIPEGPLLSQFLFNGQPADVAEEVNIEEPNDIVIPSVLEVHAKPIYLEESITRLPMLLEIPERLVAAPEFKETEIMEKEMKRVPYSKHFVTLNENTFSEPQRFNPSLNNIQQSHGSKPIFIKVRKHQVPGSKQLFLDNYKNHLSFIPLPRLNNMVRKPIYENKNRFMSSLPSESDIDAKRIAPNIITRRPRVLKLIPSPKVPS